MSRFSAVSALFAAFLLQSASGHICMVAPSQRGGFNISTPGNYACFQPQAPCGTKPSAAPAVKFIGGETHEILVTQNLNHYNVGHPGRIELRWAKFPEPTSDEGWTMLRVLPDYWAHLQATITNFSVPIALPNVDCDHCVIQARYLPNKPTEPIFHQCADVAIQSQPSVADDGTVVVLAGAPPKTGRLYAATPEQFGPGGEPVPTHSLDTGMFIADGLAAYVESLDTAFYVGGATMEGTLPDTLLALTPSGPKAPKKIVNSSGDPMEGQLDAIVANGDGLLAVTRTGNASNFFFYHVRELSVDGVLGPVLATSSPQQTFVNFLWATNVVNGKMTFLAGDENSLYKLDAVLFHVTLNGPSQSATIQCVSLDVSAYTLASIHADPATGTLYAVSPGLFMSDHAFSLITIDPSSGAVTPVSKFSAPGQFKFEYGGGLYGNPFHDGELAYLFTDPTTGGKTVARVSLSTGALVRWYSLDLGINQQVLPISSMYVPPASSLWTAQQ